jgi:magnesium chelatase subunit I
VLLGERGQGKTRLIRTLTGLLDEWTPGAGRLGAERAPVRPDQPGGQAGSSLSRRRGAGAWKHRSDRYGEKLATPTPPSATSSATSTRSRSPRAARSATRDRPLRAGPAHEPRHLQRQRAARPRRADPGRAAERLEERDIQVRGYTLRLPLDLLLVASANPEDYTNRGRIITPLKDRFGAEVRTHYPLELADEIGSSRRRRS